MGVWSQAGAVTLTGMAIVFGVLAIIYIAMKLMELALGRRIKAIVSAPCDATVESVVARGSVKRDDAVLVLLGSEGLGEIPAPMSGRLELAVKTGDAVKAGDTLFEIKGAK